MIVIEAGMVEALLVEQELDDRRRGSGIGLQGFADFLFHGFGDEWMRYGVPDPRATKYSDHELPASALSIFSECTMADASARFAKRDATQRSVKPSQKS